MATVIANFSIRNDAALADFSKGSVLRSIMIEHEKKQLKGVGSCTNI
jgi:hypothetical protein